MTFSAARLLHSHQLRILRGTLNRILRMNFGSGEPCPPSPPCPCPPSKPELPPSAPEPPPCQKSPPPCPPPLCAKIPDPANPCNYCPPTCIDPDYPDLTRLKKNQCKFQEDNGIPMFLKGGSLDVVLYQGCIILIILSCLLGVYNLVSKK